MQVAKHSRTSPGNSGKRLLIVAVLLLITALAVAGCIGNKTATSVLPAGGGTLNLTDGGPITLDPATAAEVGSASYIVQIFNGLVRLDENLEVAPDIAERWDKSADGKTYTFYLRKDAKFHDGKPVTAADFKYSWERALNPATQSLTAMTYLNDIVGATEILMGTATQLSGVKVINDDTLEVNLKTPIPYFLDKMAYPTAFVVDRANVESGSNWWKRPNGTGAFKLKEWQTDQLFVLERNSDFHGEKAKLSQVVFKLYSGGSIQQYQTGEVDVAYTGAAYMGMVTDPSNPISRELSVYSQLSLYYLGFNTGEPPFDEAKVRQAFSYAVDKDRVLSLAVNNIVPAAYGILPPDMPGYNTNLQGLTYDPQKAKQLIAESKYGSVANLPQIVLTSGGWGNYISSITGGIIEEWRRSLGVEVTVRQLEPEMYSYYLSQEKDQIFDYGWIADYPDPQDFLDILFRTGNQNNIGGYSNPQLDALLEQAAIEPDREARFRMYQNAEQIIVQDAAVLPVYFERAYVLVKPYVKDYVLSPLGYAWLNQVSIQK